jgi:hypothetical protein
MQPAPAPAENSLVADGDGSIDDQKNLVVTRPARK